MWTGVISPELRPYLFGPMRSPDVTVGHNSLLAVPANHTRDINCTIALLNSPSSSRYVPTWTNSDWFKTRQNSSNCCHKYRPMHKLWTFPLLQYVCCYDLLHVTLVSIDQVSSNCIVGLYTGISLHVIKGLISFTMLFVFSRSCELG